MLIDPEAFERCFLGWVRTVFRRDAAAPRQVAIDGKTVRRSFDRKHGRSPLHLVSAYATEHGLVLAQRTTESKGGELAVLPELLDGLDLEGCLVSLDALACRPEIAERIVDRGGDYLLALRERPTPRSRLGSPPTPSRWGRRCGPVLTRLTRATAGGCAGGCSPART